MVNSLATFALIASVAPAAMAHMSIFTTSMYGVGPAPNFEYKYWDPVVPLGPGWLQQDEWWFRGPESRKLKPKDGEVSELPAGGKFNVEIACHVAWTKYGVATTTPGSSLDACPGNSGAYHSGTPMAPDIDRNLLSGCALAIADVDDIEKVTRDNLAIFSVQQKCVQQKQTSFDIPAKMPACTGKKCICGWFWLANNGTANFYMTAFDCKVTNVAADAKKIAAPVDPTWCAPGDSSCQTVTGAKRPLYAYNYPSNIVWKGNYDRPGYHDNWSFKDGAQNDIFELDEADIAAASSVSAAAAASSSSAKEAKKSALMASMSAALASRSAQGHVPGPYTKKDGNAFAAAATTYATTKTGNVRGNLSAPTAKAKRHARDFTSEAEIERRSASPEPEPIVQLPPIAVEGVVGSADDRLGKRCTGLDHSCDLTADTLFD